MDKGSVSRTYACTCADDPDFNDPSSLVPSCEQKVIFERNTIMMVSVLSIPDAWCFLYSLYFILFKQVQWPSGSQFCLLLAVETFYAIGAASMVFLGKWFAFLEPDGRLYFQKIIAFLTKF